MKARSFSAVVWFEEAGLSYWWSSAAWKGQTTGLGLRSPERNREKPGPLPAVDAGRDDRRREDTVRRTIAAKSAQALPSRTGISGRVPAFETRPVRQCTPQPQPRDRPSSIGRRR